MHYQTKRRRGARQAVGLAALLATSIFLGAAVRGVAASDEKTLSAAHSINRSAAQTATVFPQFDCGYRAPTEWIQELRAAVARGEIPDPRMRAMPLIPRGRTGIPPAGPAEPPCLSAAHLYAFEDTNQLLLTDFSSGELIDLMTTAANALLATHGDLYDFVGFWVNFTPHHTVGTAFYKFIENDVMGIGDPSTGGTPIFNFRPDLGLGGENIEGYVMMWNINSSTWQAGSGSGAAFTRLALGQEFEHRFAMFLPDLLDGRTLQGNNGSCGRIYHWNWRVDGQGSNMEISEWVGSSPAVLEGSFVTFNTDIGGIFSYTDLYLMGYVSPAEMDAGNSELRYMDNSNCSQIYSDTISSFSSTDIIASAGPRLPDSTAAQKHFRTGWIMIHQPGDPPSPAELVKAVGILEQHMTDWSFGTLGRGTMNNSLFDDCNCNEIPDLDDIAGSTSEDCNANGIPDECEDGVCGGILGGDMNCSGTVDLADLPEFVDALLAGVFTCNADANGDEAVNGLDAAAFVDLVVP